MNAEVIQTFQNIILEFYKQNGRKFPFREKISEYNVLVSEIMLQQTQTSQVSEKFLNFIHLFPDFETLADAPLEKVLQAWQGLGYNRRAISLQKIAQIIQSEHGGKLPQTPEKLEKLPHIGPATASSIAAFAFNTPTIFIETNIRRVFIYFFFPKKNQVTDKELLPIVEKALDLKNPREWYYALMDFGVMLKKTHPELTKRSAHYKKQAPFKGSNREIRGKVLKLFLKKKALSEEFLLSSLKFEASRIKNVLTQMEKEGFLKKEGKLYIIP